MVDFQHKLKTLLQQGYHRLKHKNDILRIQDIIKNKVDLNDECLLLIDRLSVNNDSDFNERLADSVQTAFHESNGECIIEIIDSGKIKVSIINSLLMELNLKNLVLIFLHLIIHTEHVKLVKDMEILLELTKN